MGQVLDISPHPDADTLYVEKINTNDPEPRYDRTSVRNNWPTRLDEVVAFLCECRTIVSGLAPFLPMSELQNRKVLVVCNLKPRKMRGVESAGMLLCASTPDRTKVVPLDPPAACEPGDAITFEGHVHAPEDPSNKATKAWEKVAPDLYVNDEGIATYDGIAFMTPKGPVRSSIKGKIS